MTTGLPTADYNEFFADNYFHARAMFRRSAAAANAELHTIPFPVDCDPKLFVVDDLSIDVAIVRGSHPTSLVVHMSGTHGVEGFAGSAIQSALLSSSSATWAAPRGLKPTVVFVHAVNPFGFANLRRVNEHNVDLNRNHLTKDEFQAKLAKDPNAHGYMDIMPFINPTEPVNVANTLHALAGLLWVAATKGMTNLRRAITTGTYHVERGIFYGGNQLEASHRLLHDFFRAQFDLASFSHVAFLDVHTGLGPSGYDTNEVVSSPTVNLAASVQTVLPGAEAITADTASDTALSGYEHAGGFAINGYFSWFPPSTAVVGITQEFGTKLGLAVLDALRRENAATHCDLHNRLQAAEALRDAFYLHADPVWKGEVGVRGRRLFETLVQHVHEIVLRK